MPKFKTENNYVVVIENDNEFILVGYKHKRFTCLDFLGMVGRHPKVDFDVMSNQIVAAFKFSTEKENEIFWDSVDKGKNLDFSKLEKIYKR